MNMTTAPLLASDYDYHLPDALIARYPLETRSASRLLHVADGKVSDCQFADIAGLLQAGDLLVLNDTKVMKARLHGVKPTGGKFEMLVERMIDKLPDTVNTAVAAELLAQYPHLSLCHIKTSKAPKFGQLLNITDSDHACVFGRVENLFIVGFASPILPLLEQYGEMPIPPYFEREATDDDDTRYQTVFHDPAKQASVAAPTASLHFDDGVLAKLTAKGIRTAFVTLHVGAGTFAPVKADNLSDHVMHAEYAHLPSDTAKLINETHQNGGRIIAVGTTVTRTLETAHLHRDNKGQLTEFSGDTQIFIYPPYDFGVVDVLLTNFHLPKSTLLMLVSAFAGVNEIKAAYQHAIDHEYRFFSYGDAMLLEKKVSA